MADDVTIDFDDIQGFVVRGFGGLAHAGYLFFKIDDEAAFRTWLRERLSEYFFTPSTAREDVPAPAAALGLSASGLQILAGEGWLPESFPPEFIEGMVEKHRSRLLGDVGSNSPDKWNWGKEGDGEIDGVLMLFDKDAGAIETLFDRMADQASGMEETIRLAGSIPADRKEPFGFEDGFSQPIIDGTSLAKKKKLANDRDYKLNVVPAGELILGYPDGSGELPRSPAISAANVPNGLLPPHPSRLEQRDLGRNGSYLVFRQLEQDVDAFNEYLAKQSNNGNDPEEIAAKMIGRKRDGTPLIGGQSAKKGDNRFDYRSDKEGLECPIGAHIRRSNPRSSVRASSPDEALSVTNRHRILRRGRVYEGENGERGLIFVCLNASISRQFEFVQSTWCNNPVFNVLQNEPDPIVGTAYGLQEPVFTIPDRPYRRRLSGLPSWVTVKGGAYIFMPGLRALHVLAG